MNKEKSLCIQGCPQCSMTKSPDAFGVVLDAPHSALTSLVLSIVAPDSCGLDLTSFQGCSFRKPVRIRGTLGACLSITLS